MSPSADVPRSRTQFHRVPSGNSSDCATSDTARPDLRTRSTALRPNSTDYFAGRPIRATFGPQVLDELVALGEATERQREVQGRAPPQPRHRTPQAPRSPLRRRVPPRSPHYRTGPHHRSDHRRPTPARVGRTDRWSRRVDARRVRRASTASDGRRQNLPLSCAISAGIS